VRQQAIYIYDHVVIYARCVVSLMTSFWQKILANDATELLMIWYARNWQRSRI